MKKMKVALVLIAGLWSSTTDAMKKMPMMFKNMKSIAPLVMNQQRAYVKDCHDLKSLISDKNKSIKYFNTADEIFNCYAYSGMGPLYNWMIEDLHAVIESYGESSLRDVYMRLTDDERIRFIDAYQQRKILKFGFIDGHQFEYERSDRSALASLKFMDIILSWPDNQVVACWLVEFDHKTIWARFVQKKELAIKEPYNLQDDEELRLFSHCVKLLSDQEFSDLIRHDKDLFKKNYCWSGVVFDRFFELLDSCDEDVVFEIFGLMVRYQPHHAALRTWVTKNLPQAHKYIGSDGIKKIYDACEQDKDLCAYNRRLILQAYASNRPVFYQQQSPIYFLDKISEQETGVDEIISGDL